MRLNPFRRFIAKHGYSVRGLADSTGIPSHRIFAHSAGHRCLGTADLERIANLVLEDVAAVPCPTPGGWLEDTTSGSAGAAAVGTDGGHGVR